ncbi:MAG: metallophosphoesterase [Paludibacteraceae bacterium]|nr:metallophosphoesterase [Paludibacteraceae bacterium]
MRKLHYLYMVLSVVVLSGCTTLFPNLDLVGMFYGSSPRTDVRFEQSMAYNDSAGYAHITVLNEEYPVYVCTDSHVDSTTRNLGKFLHAFHHDMKSPLAIHLGDLINAQGNYPRFDSAWRASYYAPTEEFMKVQPERLFLTAGNHDIYFGQWEQFRQYFKTSTYWFDTQTASGKVLDLFICLDSSEGTLGVKQLAWLEQVLQQARGKNYRHVVVFTHTHMFKQDASQGHTSNYVMEETYRITGLMSKYGVDMYWSGHDHSREVTQYGGVTYIIVDAIQDPEEKPAYMVATMGEKIGYRFVEL